MVPHIVPRRNIYVLQRSCACPLPEMHPWRLPPSPLRWPGTLRMTRDPCGLPTPAPACVRRLSATARLSPGSLCRCSTLKDHAQASNACHTQLLPLPAAATPWRANPTQLTAATTQSGAGCHPEVTRHTCTPCSRQLPTEGAQRADQAAKALLGSLQETALRCTPRAAAQPAPPQGRCRPQAAGRGSSGS